MFNAEDGQETVVIFGLQPHLLDCGKNVHFLGNKLVGDVGRGSKLPKGLCTGLPFAAVLFRQIERYRYAIFS